MGWTTTNKPAGVTATEFLLHHTGMFTWSDTAHKYTVLDTAIVKLRTFYAAVERVDGVTGERTVWAAVILLTYGASKWDSNNFGWKDMDETMGPNESECPARILDLLTPTESKYANDWRARCRANIENRKSVAALARGQAILLAGKRYTAEYSMDRKGWAATDEAGKLWRLSMAQLARAELVGAPAAPIMTARPVAVATQISLF